MNDQPAQDRMPIVVADYTQEQVDALTHGQIADRLRKYDHPLLKAAADSLDYLNAQEGLLEQAQVAAEKARAELAEHKRPLDEPMARLNRRVIELTAELDALRLKLPLHDKPDGEVIIRGGTVIAADLYAGPASAGREFADGIYDFCITDGPAVVKTPEGERHE